jgi:glutamate 5-kinase
MKQKSKRIVLKFGSGILTRLDRPEPDPIQLRKLVEAVAILKSQGHSIIIVSSGAVASGLKPLGHTSRPTAITDLQACAAVGQTHLMHAYESLLRDHGLHVAQLLVTHSDLENETRAKRFSETLHTLIKHPSVVPVINENDSVSTEELKYGDNDQLSSRIARLCKADILMLLTSVPGLLDPSHPDQGPIPHVTDIQQVKNLAKEEKGKLSVGGMISKLTAVEAALEDQITCIIASGRNAENIPEIIAGKGICTRFSPKK